jgi:hypothetical protein
MRGAAVLAIIPLGGVRDRDVFIADAGAQLPLANIEVPTVALFVATPLLILGIHACFHLRLLKLRRALRPGSRDVGPGRALDEAIHPSLIADAAILLRAAAREAFLPDYAGLTRATLAWATLGGADLFLANLTGPDLRNMRSTGATFFVATLNGADLRAARLTGSDLGGASLKGADPSLATLTGANLTAASLAGADLREAILTDARLHEAILTGADLRDATLTGVDMVRTLIGNAALAEIR